jgi:transcription initiation factor IIE alpha subunit
MTGEPMTEESQEKENLTRRTHGSNLAMTDALAKLLIAKGVITDDEFKTQLGTEKANYLAVLKRLH